MDFVKNSGVIYTQLFTGDESSSSVRSLHVSSLVQFRTFVFFRCAFVLSVREREDTEVLLLME